MSLQALLSLQESLEEKLEKESHKLSSDELSEELSLLSANPWQPASKSITILLFKMCSAASQQYISEEEQTE